MKIPHLAATALCLTLAATPVVAQTAPAAGNTTPIETQQPGQFLAETYIGTNVYNNQNETLGEVNDLLIGQDGKIVGVIIGVGGFLGIGERDVAVPFESIQMQMNADATGATGGGTAGTGAGGPGTAGTPAGGTPAAGTGTTTTTGAAGTATDPTVRTPTPAAGVAPSLNMRLVVNLTRDQIRAMPEFRSLDDQPAPAATGTGAGGTGTGAGGAGTTPARP